MSEDQPFSVSRFLSAMLDGLCMFFFPFIVRNSFKSMTSPWNSDTLSYIVRNFLALKPKTVGECMALIGSSICVVSATIHLTLYAKGKKQFLNRYGLIRNISALVTVVGVLIVLYVFSNAGMGTN
jgi:hypothetical protein